MRAESDPVESWAIFPLHPIVRDEHGHARCGCGDLGCEDVGKHPAMFQHPTKGLIGWGSLEAGEKFMHADGWESDAGHGIATGRVSNVFVVDCDYKPTRGIDGWAALQRLAAGRAVPQTLVVRTGSGGRHVYFQWPGWTVRNSIGRLAPGVDVRGDRGYVVAPRSPHRSGSAYAVELEAPIAAAPRWLLRAIRDLQPKIETKQQGDGLRVVPPGSPEESQRIADATTFLQNADPSISGENGHTRLFIVAQKLVRWFELSDAASVELLRAYFNPRCVPPWSDAELLRKVDQARRFGEFDTREECNRFARVFLGRSF